MNIDRWKAFMTALGENALYRPEYGDEYFIRKDGCLVLYRVNQIPVLGVYESLADLRLKSPIVRFSEDIERMLDVAKHLELTLHIEGIYIANRRFEVSFCEVA